MIKRVWNVLKEGFLNNRSKMNQTIHRIDKCTMKKNYNESFAVMLSVYRYSLTT